jgi:hypothetical protein
MPLFAVVWLLVRCSLDGSPVFFFAQRAGMDGRPITLREVPHHDRMPVGADGSASFPTKSG